VTPEEQSIHDDVQRFGWSAMNVFEAKEAPGFQYSIGFFRSFNHPEVLIFGQQSKVMHGMLTRIASGIREGNRYAVGTEAEDILDGYRCVFRTVSSELVPEYLGFANWFYDYEEFPVVQCIWPDRAGRFPWDPEASAELRRREPVLDSPKPRSRA
jgi:hypothetical protein